jgi:hypothetical protein
MTEFAIAKTDEAQGLVYGWANIIATADGQLIEDSQGDLIEPAELEKAAVDFMLHHRATGEMHEGDAVGSVIEAFVSSPDKLRAMGFPDEVAKVAPHGLWIGVKVPPLTFAKVKSGQYQGFSIQGTAERHVA